MRETTKITSRDINHLPNGTHRIEPNFYIRVRGDYRNYFLRINVNGVRRDIAIGSSRDVSFPLARAKMLKIKAQLSNGETLDIDMPDVDESEQVETKTFKDLAEEAIDVIQNQRRWTNAKHAHQWRQTVRDFAYPVIGNKNVDDITTDDILEIIVPIWDTKTETASRLLKRLEKIFQYAIFKKMYTHPNPAVWTGNLEMMLPKSTLIMERKHFEAPTTAELKDIVPKLLTGSIVSKCALFAILTACRVQEVAHARWDEVDFQTRTFSVPPERRKDKRDYPHRVPLSNEAVLLLKSIERVGEYIFPSPRNAQEPVSKESPRVCLVRHLKRNVTIHGCRSTFRDWCAETGVRDILAEKSLMHTTGNEVQQAYQRADLLEQRRPIMQDWANFLFEQ